jgi:hypothetical protein
LTRNGAISGSPGIAFGHEAIGVSTLVGTLVIATP